MAVRVGAGGSGFHTFRGWTVGWHVECLLLIAFGNSAVVPLTNAEANTSKANVAARASLVIHVW